MTKTLLLVFIHGFKGGDDTFARFPPHLKALLSHALPQLNIVQIQYPKFETRGDLAECVSNFKEWYEFIRSLLNKPQTDQQGCKTKLSI